MAETNPSFDSKNILDKENIRKNIRNALSTKLNTHNNNIDLNADSFVPIPDLLKEFVTRFRAAGGKYLPCSPTNLVSSLVRLIQSQKYNTVLNTSPDLGKYLSKYNIRCITSINGNETADAVIVFSESLVARSGSIGFSPVLNLYPSIKNLAKDVIVVSFERCLFSDMSQVLEYQRKRTPGTSFNLNEFILPTKPENVNGQIEYTPLDPRFILLLVLEDRLEKKSSEPAVEKSVEHGPTEVEKPRNAACAQDNNSSNEESNH